MSDVPISRRAKNKARDVRHNLGVKVLGTKYNEEEWMKKQEDPFYWESRNHPHRDLLVEKVLKYRPRSVLEIGCNTGPNLFRLSEAIPEAHFTGVDISQVAVENGRKRFKEIGMDNVELIQGKADDLSLFKDQEFDLVFTDAVLIYIGKDKIDQVANEMMRLVNKAIVLIEYFDSSSTAEGKLIFEKGYWKRDYVALFRKFQRVTRIETSKITKDQWNDEYWSSIGAVVEVVLGNEQ